MGAKVWPLLQIAGGLAVAAALAPSPALAAPRDFRIPAKPLTEALIDFAVQADLSIDTRAARACRRFGNAVAGRMEAREALRRLLDGTGCTFETVGPRSLRIIVVPRPARPPAPVERAPAPMTVVPVEDVIVTATRRPTVSTRLPYAVSALPSELLDAQGVDDAGEVATLTPGLTVTNLGSGRDKLIVRGLSDGALTGRNQSMVGIYLDDLRLTYSAPDPDLRLVDVQRVELLRGPQGSLYGAGSIGGVYHIVTRQPELETWELRVAGDTSYTVDGGANFAVEGVLNAPLGDRAAVRVAAWREFHSGYLDNPVRGEEDVNDTTRSGVRAALRVELMPRWEVAAGLVAQTITSADSQYVEPGGGDLDRRVRVAEPHHNDFGAGYVTLSGSTDYARLRWTTALLDHHFNTRYDASTALADFGATPGPAAAWDERLSIRSWISEVTLSAPIGAKVPWLVGGFISDGDEAQRTRLRTGSLIYAEDRADEVSEIAVYGEASLPLGPWTLTAGGRYFWAEMETRSEIDAPGVGSAAFQGEFQATGFAPKVVLRYQVDDRWMAYAQAAEGYRTGGFNTSGPIGQVFHPRGSGLQPARLYRGDELWSYEAGAKWADRELGLTLQGAAFMVNWEDIQSTQLLPSGAPYTANIGRGRTVGLELEGAWSIGDFDFTANLLLNEPELDRPDPGFLGAPDSPLAGVSRFAVGGTARYVRPLGNGLTATVDARLAFVGPSRLTFDAATAPVMGDYWSGRIAAGLESDRWRVSLFVENPANVRGDTFAYGNPFTVRSERQDTPLRPATLGVSMDWRF